MSESFQFVLVSDSNLNAAAEIHAASWRESHKDICSEEFVAAHTAKRQLAYLQGELEKGKQLFVLIDPEPVGLISLDGNLIENLYVYPTYWNKGYGAALLRFVEGRCKTPRLWVLSSNQRARLFYENRGYQWSGREKFCRQRYGKRKWLKQILLWIDFNLPVGSQMR